MLCVDELLALEVFQPLPAERLQWICDRAELTELPAGELLLREGDSSLGFFILISGQIGLTRRSDGLDMPIGQHSAPAYFGEVPVLTDEPSPVTVQALGPCRLYKLSAEDFLTLLHGCRIFERSIFKTVQQRVRGLESFIRGREKMAALGTLSAGLAHELNNPASALVRALKNVTPALLELQRMNLVYGQRQVDEAHTQQWLQARDQGYDAIVNRTVNPISLRDREDDITDWLENYGVEQAWKLAEPLAEAGIETDMLEHLMAPWRNDPTEMRDMGLRWLSLSFEVMSMITSGLRGAERIAELVHSMKSYSYLDRGAQQTVDIHEGLEDTLRLFSHKLKQGIEVRRTYDPTLPKILAFGSELNQVWTNLIDNAIDAMNDVGVLELMTVNHGDHLQVHVIDSGAGIPPDVRSRLFEPFFTTKAVGKGSGLGLEVVRRIVENRHRGTITVNSQPGRTEFSVCLPTSEPST
jgi:signal transduction histidine kinase